MIDSQSGLKVFFISKDDLIASKLAAGRMRDLADVEEMQATTQAQESQRPPKNASDK